MLDGKFLLYITWTLLFKVKVKVKVFQGHFS